MQQPSAQLVLSSNRATTTVHPGDLIGRLAAADMVIADPRISEAHALVSLRSRSLRLLALRGALFVDGQDVDAVTLARGLRIDLAEGLYLTVEEVELPTHSLVLCGLVQGPVELSAPTYSLVVGDDAGERVLGLVAGRVPDAVGHLWSSGSRLWICLRDQEAEPIQVGAKWMVEGRALRVIQVPLDGTNDTVTEKSGGLVIVARYVTVHVRYGARTAVITGRPANLVTELVRFDGKPIPWEMLARQVWGDRDRELLRDNFDATRSRLRRQLRDLDIRDDLVCLDGSGNVELVLHSSDRIIDES
ncbi:MAG: hypothetical protein IPK80_28090 [Nannocystis sp.]|nr:hypothetical protein [Nannocystis sp.]